MSSTQINLTPDEIMQAGMVGIMRRVEGLKHNRKQAYRADANAGWVMDIEGALGEFALAKYLGVFWSKGRLRAPDVGDVDARTTAYPNGHLFIHDSDPDDRKVYLVVGSNGSYQVRGWVYAGEVKKPAYWKNLAGRTSSYCVPQSELRMP